MSPDTMLTLMGGAISTLFAALLYTLRQRAEDWKGLYMLERDAHDKTRTESSIEVRKNSEALIEIASYIKRPNP